MISALNATFRLVASSFFSPVVAVVKDFKNAIDSAGVHESPIRSFFSPIIAISKSFKKELNR